MTKHTPGPWERAAVGAARYPSIAATEDGETINIGSFSREQDRDLCLAAPDMLEALKECLDAELRRREKLLPGAPATTYCEARIAKIRAAIAKAEGRTP